MSGVARHDALTAIDGATLLEVIDEAARVAAITCSRPGADPPTLARLDGGASGRPTQLT